MGWLQNHLPKLKNGNRSAHQHHSLWTKGRHFPGMSIKSPVLADANVSLVVLGCDQCSMTLTVQVLLDMTTPKALFDQVEARVKAHVKANPLDFTGDCAISCDKNAGVEPLKIALVVCWSYSFNGAPCMLSSIPQYYFLGGYAACVHMHVQDACNTMSLITSHCA